MKLRAMWILTALATLAAGALSAYAWAVLPADAQLPIHWNLAGEPDRFANKAWALLLGPGIILGIGALFAVLPVLEPRRENFERSGSFFRVIWALMVLFLLVLHGAVVFTGLGYPVSIPMVLGVSLSVLFLVMGNMLSKTRSNFFMGIRTPWTLSSEEVWIKTHRLGGRLFMLTGLVGLVTAFFFSPQIIFFVIMGGTMLSALIAVVYSFFAYKAEEAG